MNKGTIVIPEGTGTWGKGMEVFDISKLDQIPVATVQVRPQYPFEMRRAGISGQVVVDFIVDTSDLSVAQSAERVLEIFGRYGRSAHRCAPSA